MGEYASGEGLTPMGGGDSGAELLADVYEFLGRFIVYPSEHAQVAHALWIAHTWLMDAWDSTPRIAFLSPEPGSGKSRCLEVTGPLVPRAVHAINVTSAYLFRKVSDEDGAPTILYDEIDTVFGPRTSSENEDVRGMLNAGHRKGATAGRCVIVGKKVKTEELPCYCAVALAGLNDMPDTLMTRSVVIRMRRRAPNEAVEPWRARVNEPEAEKLASRLRDWSDIVFRAVNGAWPDMPQGIEDRNADIWEALLAVADAAGGDWPERARVAAVALVADARTAHVSLGVMLLRDLRRIFTEAAVDKLSTEEILTNLHDIDESPWSELRGKPLEPRGLAQRLGKYGIKSKNVRIGETVAKGYELADLLDPFSRYLPPIPTGGISPAEGEAAGNTLAAPEAATSATSATCPNCRNGVKCLDCYIKETA